MRKIIIVNNNMNVGGVQKSLCNLLWAIHGRYEVTLYLFSCRGEYLQDIPAGVKVVECGSLFRYLGISQGQCRGADRLIRGALALLCRIFGRSKVMKLLLASQKVLDEEYDCAIAYLQNGNIRNLYGGVQDFVLHRVKANQKVAFLHCDYANCGADHPENNRLVGQFDRIAVCSDGCGRAFTAVMPSLEAKCVTVRNSHRYDKIQRMADTDPVEYDGRYRNVVMVSRLSHEKGIERAIEAAAAGIARGIPVMLHIVGSGPMQPMLEQRAAVSGIAENVRFYGLQSNPYRFMKNAELFLMTSYHEAAPMVIDEAQCLGLPVLTVETTSSHEMVTAREGGWVCANSQEAFTEALLKVLSDSDAATAVRIGLRSRRWSNDEMLEQFTRLIEG